MTRPCKDTNRASGKGHATRYRIASIAMGLVLATHAAADDSPARSAEPDYRRAATDRFEVRRQASSTPLPEELGFRVVEAQAKRAEAPRQHDRRRAIESRARSEARWMAERLVGSRGLAEYYRVGFHAGLRSALHDPHFGNGEFTVGLRDGRRSSVARDDGRLAGRDLADEQAFAVAVAEVESQFSDLSRDPRRLSAPRSPGIDVAPPALPRVSARDVMRDYPLATFQRNFGPRGGHFDGWGWDAPRLHGAKSHRDFYDRAWRDPARAFELWRHERPGTLRRFHGPGEQRLFIDAFHVAFERAIAKAHARALERAHQEGIEDGWAYGSFVQDEVQYRRGFNAGYSECFVDFARRAFDDAFPRAWDRAYDGAFEDWSRNVKPAIEAVRLFDGNDDGVFEPGEGIDIEFVVINYGGGEGRVPVGLTGSGLMRDTHESLFLPARRTTEGRLNRAALRPQLQPRSQARLDLTVADERRRLDVDVRRPLQFLPSSMRLERDDLAGRLFVEVAVENISRRELSAAVAARAISGGSYGDRVELPSVGPGSSRRVTFELDGFDPLNLLAGDVGIELLVDRQGVLQDRLRHDVSDVASDLANRDLMRYLIDSTRSPVAAVDANRMRHLVLRRLRADWRQAVASSGNPYRRDLKRQGSETALGELVAVWSELRRESARPELFDGLHDDVVALSRDLPGVHPWLRKAMRKLAAPLP